MTYDDAGDGWEMTKHSKMDKRIKQITEIDKNEWYKGLCVDIYVSKWVVEMRELVEGAGVIPRTIADEFLIMVKDRAMSLIFWETLDTTFATSDEIKYIFCKTSVEAYAWMSKDLMFRDHIAQAVVDDDVVGE